MSLEEMEQTWNQQSLSPPLPVEPVRRAASHLTRTLLIAWGMLAVALFAFLLRVHQIWIDPAHTLANSFWNLIIAAAGVAGVGVGVFWSHHFAAKFRLLAHDTIRCVDLMIHSAEKEIKSIRRDMPIMMLVYLGLFALAKHQSISAGLEDAAEWNFIGFLMLIFGVIGAFMYHFLRAFLRPHLAELQAVRRQFDDVA